MAPFSHVPLVGRARWRDRVVFAGRIALDVPHVSRGRVGGLQSVLLPCAPGLGLEHFLARAARCNSGCHTHSRPRYGSNARFNRGTSVKVAHCPACGAIVAFHVSSSLVTICEYCHSAVARGDKQLEDLGKVADLVDTESPLRLGRRDTWEIRATRSSAASNIDIPQAACGTSGTSPSAAIAGPGWPKPRGVSTSPMKCP